MSNQPNPVLVAALRRFSQFTSGAAILVGSAVLVGWLGDVPALKSILPIWVTMKANTALAFVLAALVGLCLGLPGRLSRRRVTRRLRAQEQGLLLTLRRIVQQAVASGAARAGSITQAMPPALAGAVALSQAAPWAI
jgi:hypothetical protein